MIQPSKHLHLTPHTRFITFHAFLSDHFQGDFFGYHATVCIFFTSGEGNDGGEGGLTVREGRGGGGD
jgi:hypothetical protein